MRNINLYQNPILFIAYLTSEERREFAILPYNDFLDSDKNKSITYLAEKVNYDKNKFKLNFNHPVKEIFFGLEYSRLDKRVAKEFLENNNVDIIENNNENIQINEIIYLDIKTIFIINKYIDSDDSIYI
jgi:hypothetical protein